jgi:hypothetical protein
MVSDLAAWKVRGQVRTLRREFAEWNPSDETWGDAGGISKVTFRRDGQVSEGESQNPDGSVARWDRVFDDSGRVIESRDWTDDGPRTRRLYSYDARGRPAETLCVTPDGTRRQIETYRYTGTGRKTRISHLAAEQLGMRIDGYGIEGTNFMYGAPDAATLTTVYDERELPVEATFHDANGDVVRRIVFSRDSEGHVLTEVVLFGGETPFPGMLNHPDDVPLEARTQMAAVLKTVFADRIFSSVAYAYDPQGRLVERILRMGALSEERTTFQHDDHDNPIAESSERRDREMGIKDGAAHTKENKPRGHHLRFDLQYDSRGNWIERVVWSRIGSQTEFQRSNIERRTITYYDL